MGAAGTDKFVRVNGSELNVMGKDKKISVITPVYYGKKYLKGLIRQMEVCQEKLMEPWKMEFLIINDAPDDPIAEEIHKSETVEIRIFNSAINKGIHGARVFGLSCAVGAYILFLDQDDRILPDYMQSQIQVIGDADAVVCRCIHEKKPLYQRDLPFESVVTKEYMMTKGCPIISPGQVLLKRTSIPKVWERNRMHCNGSDDYLLWLCMAAQNRTFALNQKILFEHVVDENNLSLDFGRMRESEKEMYGILAKEKVFPEKDLQKISVMLKGVSAQRMALLAKFRKMFMVLNQMMEYRESGYPVGKYLKTSGVDKVAIYGAGYVGKRLVGELREHSVDVAYFIDRNADYLEETIPVYKPEDPVGQVNMVIISLVGECEALKRDVLERYGCRVNTICEILGNMREKMP